MLSFVIVATPIGLLAFALARFVYRQNGSKWGGILVGVGGTFLAAIIVDRILMGAGVSAEIRPYIFKYCIWGGTLGCLSAHFYVKRETARIQPLNEDAVPNSTEQ